MARIPQAFIDDLVARTDIVPLIDSRVQLKRQGSEYTACCPFHDEKTPSFTVSPSKQFYHCFGCGAHGTALGFLMEYDRLEFRDAVEELAKMHGLEIPQEAQHSGPRIDPTLYDAADTAQRLFARELRNTPAAIDYLKSRGIDGETAKAFGIGFAPDAWQTVTDAVGSQKLAVAAGLAIRNDSGRVYDRFRNRITFPIRDLRGRVVSFGGRKFADGDDGPKYLNGSETDIFHKGRMLYGLYEARQAVKEPQRLTVVEGYMDVVSLAQFGVPEAVATLGTATTPEHLDLLFRTTPQVVFCFDGDRAGRDAAWKAVERALPSLRDGREVRLLFLPDGEDPDSIVRSEGADAFRAKLDQATPLSQFLLDHLKASADLGSVDGRAKLVDLARPHLNALAAGAFRKGMVQAVADLAGLQTADIENALQATGHSSRQAPPPRPARPGQTGQTGRRQTSASVSDDYGPMPPGMHDGPPPGYEASDPGQGYPDDQTHATVELTGPAARACRLLLEQPGLADSISESAEFGDDAAARALAELIGHCQATPGQTAGQLGERLRGTLLDSILRPLWAKRLPDGLDMRAEFDAALTLLTQNHVKKRLSDLLQLARSRELTQAESHELTGLLSRG